MKPVTVAIVIFAAWNLIVFLIYGLDKLKAKAEKWRISEKALLLMALFFGARYSFRGPDIGSKVNSAMDKAANMVQGDQENKVE